MERRHHWHLATCPISLLSRQAAHKLDTSPDANGVFLGRTEHTTDILQEANGVFASGSLILLLPASFCFWGLRFRFCELDFALERHWILLRGAAFLTSGSQLALLGASFSLWELHFSCCGFVFAVESCMAHNCLCSLMVLCQPRVSWAYARETCTRLKAVFKRKWLMFTTDWSEQQGCGCWLRQRR